MTDTYEKIDVGMEKIDAVMHLADVHIRLTKRHEEYREAFTKTYAYAKTLPKNSVILIAGDLVHSKVDLSPEAVQYASEFLKNLADIRPVILISGNHDCLLTNKTRLDSLTPIVQNLNHKSLFYWKKTGLFGVGNILFNNMSVFDDVTHYVNINKITKKIQNGFDVKVALFHGGIHGSMTDLGYLIENKIVPREFFDGHDIVMLGDIHKAQTFYIEKFLTLEDAEKFSEDKESDGWSVVEDDTFDGVRLRKNNTPVFRYPGSLIQQNHGETLLNHGFSVWDIPKKTFEHVEIQNDYGYFTIEINDGKLMTDIASMPSKPKLRVKCRESVATEVKKIIAEIKQTHFLSDLVYMRVDGEDSQKTINAQTIANLNQISNVEYQNKLIESYLKDKYQEMDEDTMAEVLGINKTLNASLSKDDQSKSVRWKPIKFEFSNMFSYGEGNTIDFTKLTDVYGLFAANASGKSSLMDALCFTIFDKSARAFKASHVMNTQKMTFIGRFTFEINDVRYVIERKGTRDKKNNVKVDVTFVKMVGEEELPLNAEARRSTNEIIRDYVGSYDDFVLTSLALQGNQGSFIDMGQTERKDLLSQFIGLTLFDRLVASAANASKDLSGAIKVFNKEDSTKKVLDMAEDVKRLKERMTELNQQKDIVGVRIKELETEIKDNQDKIVVLENVPTDVVSLEVERSSLLDKIDSGKNEIIKIQADLETIKQAQAVLVSELEAFGSVNLEEKFTQHEAAAKNQQKIERDLEKLRTLVSEKLKKLEHLAEHKYDPSCSFCMDNVFVRDAVVTKGSLDADKVRGKELMVSLGESTKLVAELSPFVVQYKQSLEIRQKRTALAGNLARKELALNNSNTALEKYEDNLLKVNTDIQLYEKSKEVIETNRTINNYVKKINTELQKTLIHLKNVTADYVSAYSKKVSLTDQIALIKEQIEKVEKAEQEHAAYQYYLAAVGRDGIPYQIMSDVVPKIEQEVNNILSQIVEFGIAIETDGKNVNVLIKYEDRKWPLDLSSGMEKFICALALRVALINISNLPRPNFLVVDEGMGALDSDNMAMVHALFDYLKTNFEFIIVISHLDAMRDMVDKQIEIKKVNGFSCINHV
jgi:DNA repair exonuclease SbcCD nuclease subunit/predicted ABC-type transport system involved in lysophospholipase L1 biosynthesis ATPase subunit